MVGTVQTALLTKRGRKPAAPKQGKQQQAAAPVAETKKPGRKAAAPADQGKQQQAAAPALAPVKKPGRKAAVSADQGKQQQAAAPVAAPEKKATRKKTTTPAGSGRGRGRQQQAGSNALAGMDAARAHLNGGKSQQGDDQSQGSAGGSAAGKDAATEAMRGGTKQVLIEYATMAPRMGREGPPEEYPFGTLEPAKKENGEIAGPSFFIPDSDKAQNRVAAARKRHKGVTFWTRREMASVNGKGPKVMGTRVFKAPPGTKA